jgi:hypothetical protein
MSKENIRELLSGFNVITEMNIINQIADKYAKNHIIPIWIHMDYGQEGSMSIISQTIKLPDGRIADLQINVSNLRFDPLPMGMPEHNDLLPGQTLITNKKII